MYEFSITIEKKRVSSQFVNLSKIRPPWQVTLTTTELLTLFTQTSVTHSLSQHWLSTQRWLKSVVFFSKRVLFSKRGGPCQKSPLIDHQEGEVGGIPSASRWGCWPPSRWACWQLLLCRQAMGWAASTPRNSEEPHIHYSGHLSSSLQLPTSNVKTNTPPNITRKQVLDFVYEYDFI